MRHETSSHSHDGTAPRPDSAPNRRSAVAQALDDAADSLHARADEFSRRPLADATERAARAVDATAAFVRDWDSKSMLKGASTLARKHPGVSLAAVAVAGFLLGRSSRRPL